MGGAYGLDFTAVLMTGGVRHVDLALLAEVLPEVEGFVVAGLATGEDD